MYREGTVKLTIKPMQTPGKQSSDCRGTFPRRKGAPSEYPIVLGTNQVPTQVEQIVNSSMNAQETMTQVESKIEPDGIVDDFWWESMAFV